MKSKAKKVLVTGGNGFIGSCVVRLLCEGGYKVRVLVHNEKSETKRIDGLELEKVYGDVREKEVMRQALDDCDSCVHLASLSSWSKLGLPEMKPIVLEGTQNLLEILRDRKKEGKDVRTVFCSSSAAVNGTKAGPVVYNEESPFELVDVSGMAYAKAKHSAECMIAKHTSEYELDTVIVCPAETYGPQDFGMVTAEAIKDFILNDPAYAIHGGTAIVHVEDVAVGIIGALEKGRSGERYILGGDNVTIEQLAKLTLELVGQEDKKVMVIGGTILKMAMKATSWLKLPRKVDPQQIEYAQFYWFMDSSKAKKELGFNPRSAKAVIASVVRWLDDAGYLDDADVDIDDEVLDEVESGGKRKWAADDGSASKKAKH